MAKKVLIATYSQSGTTQRVADQLANLLSNSDQFKITVPEGTFSPDMFKTSDIAKQQIADQNYPALKQPVPDVSQYDLILVGSPVWSGGPATPVHTFLSQIKGYQGQIAPFYTDAGTPGNYEQVFKEWADGLKVLPGHEGTSGLQGWVNNF